MNRNLQSGNQRSGNRQDFCFNKHQIKRITVRNTRNSLGISSLRPLRTPYYFQDFALDYGCALKSQALCALYSGFPRYLSSDSIIDAWLRPCVQTNCLLGDRPPANDRTFAENIRVLLVLRTLDLEHRFSLSQPLYRRFLNRNLQSGNRRSGNRQDFVSTNTKLNESKLEILEITWALAHWDPQNSILFFGFCPWLRVCP